VRTGLGSEYHFHRGFLSAAGAEKTFFYSTLDANTSTSTPKTTKSLNKKDRMATDEEYMAFLDKANEDLSVGKSKTTEKKDELKATDKDINIPSTLVKATEDAWYISDADEPFVPVSLWVDSNTLPDERKLFPTSFPSPQSSLPRYTNLSMIKQQPSPS